MRHIIIQTNYNKSRLITEWKINLDYCLEEAAMITCNCKVWKVDSRVEGDKDEIEL